MYPPKNPDEEKAKVSQDNARDIVEAIDNLICLRIMGPGSDSAPVFYDKLELQKRRITDYLLVTDPRAGVFLKP